MIQTAIDLARQFAESMFGLHVRLSPLYVATMVLIAFGLYWRSNSGKSFIAWLFPADMYFHRSHLTDIKLFLVGRGLTAFGVFGHVAVSAFIAATLTDVLSDGNAVEAAWHPVFLSLLLLTANDFGVYWTHRLHHEMAVFWPFHSVHHSAEVLTPITVYRKHPVYDLISQFVRSVFVGVLQGALLGLFVGKVDLATIAGINAFYVIFNALGANLRHSHIWLGYGRILSRVLISPAQHQIHHSVDPKHRNKNYGEVLALWDWAFGTLYVPREREALTFGLADEAGAIEQPHSTLIAALLIPFRDCWRAVRGRPQPANEADTA